MRTYTDAELATVYPVPGPDDHKYTRGVLGLVTGSTEYPGAALLSVSAAVRTGCGMVRYLGNPHLHSLVQLKQPEVVCNADIENARVQAWAAGSGAIGEGLQPRLDYVIGTNQAAVLDAAALNLAAQYAGLGNTLGPHKILTPHSGELAEMLSWLSALMPQEWATHIGQEPPTREEIEKDRPYWAEQTSALMGATVLLKGSTTLIASPGTETASITIQAPWLATAGSGDTLTGVMGSLLAQAIARAGTPEHPEQLGAEFFVKIAATAVRIHGLAALAVHGGQPAGPTPPTLVAEKIPEAVATLLRGKTN